MNKINTNTLYIKQFLIVMGLLLCAPATADEVNAVEVTTNKAQIAENSAAEPVVLTAVELEKPVVNTQEVKKSLNNPLAALVENALKSPRGYAEAAAIYCKEAKYGDADAQYALGWMYANGRGVVADEKVAAQLYTMAAEQGHTRAKESLATLAGVTPESTLLACMLPDPPPAPIVSSSTNTNRLDANVQNERQEITARTAALFKSQASILRIVKKLAPRYNIDTNLAMSFIAVESNFNVQATSPKNAQGLMQLIPETAARFGVKDAYKAEDNIKGGLAYLQWLLAYFEGDVQLVAAAYNAGEGAVQKYKGVPPYAETQQYVKKIAKLYNNASHPYKDNLVKSSPFLKKFKKTTS